jgi:hypothetical protein
MKRSLFIVLFCAAIGCSHSARRILPPIYEQYYPCIVGIRSYEGERGTDIDSMLTAILIASSFAAGVVEEPFDNAMIDIILAVDEFNACIKRSGFLPVRYEIEGELVIQLMHPNGDPIERYSANGKTEQSSLNPFCRCNSDNMLFTELITSIIDDIDDDFHEEQPAIIHTFTEEEKTLSGTAQIEYPTLTHFSRNGVYATATIRGGIPLSAVTLRVSERYGDSLFSHQLYYEKTCSLNGRKEWLYELHCEDRCLPFSKQLSYEIESIDAMGKRDAISSGMLTTISEGMFRLKQAEVLAHGTIVTAFGGLVVVMMLYSI